MSIRYLDEEPTSQVAEVGTPETPAATTTSARRIRYIEEPPAEEPGYVAKAWNAVKHPFTPLTNIPRVDPNTGIDPLSGKKFNGDFSIASENMGRDVAEGMTSPFGIATLGVGPTIGAVKRSLPLVGKGLQYGWNAFLGYLGTKQIIETPQNIAEAEKTGNKSEKYRAYGNAIFGPLMVVDGAAGIRAAMKPTPTQTPATPKPIPPEAVKAFDEVFAKEKPAQKVTYIEPEKPVSTAVEETAPVVEPVVESPIVSEAKLAPTPEPKTEQTTLESTANRGDVSQAETVAEPTPAIKPAPRDMLALADEPTTKSIPVDLINRMRSQQVDVVRGMDGDVGITAKIGGNKITVTAESAPNRGGFSNTGTAIVHVAPDGKLTWHSGGSVPELVKKAALFLENHTGIKPTQDSVKVGKLKRGREQGSVITPTEEEIAAFAARIGKATKDLTPGDMAMLRFSLLGQAAGKTVEQADKDAAADMVKNDLQRPAAMGGTGNIETRGMAENVNRTSLPQHSKIEILRNREYETVNNRQMMRDVKELSEADLAAATPSDNFYHAAQVELAARFEREGRIAEADTILVELEKAATKMGQNNAFIKALYARSPRFYAMRVNRALLEVGADPLTKPQLQELKTLLEKANTAQDAMDAAAAKWRNDKTAANLDAFDAADLAQQEAHAKLVNRTAEMSPRKFWTTIKTIMQGGMLAPVSLVANEVGNVSFAFPRAAKNSSKTVVDVLDAKLTGHERQVAQSPIVAFKNVVATLPKDLVKAWNILRKGAGEVQVKEGGQHGQALHPLDALKTLIAYAAGREVNAPTYNGKLSAGQLADLTVQATLGAPAEMFLRGLGAADATHVGIAMARLVANESKLRRVDGKPAPLTPRELQTAAKFPELFFDLATSKRIRDGASGAVFQQESKGIRMINGWMHSKGSFADFAFATVAPYKLTPWNITGEILSYTPLVATAKMGWQMRQVRALQTKAVRFEAMGRASEAKRLMREADDARLAAKDAAGKLVVGTMLTGAAWYLYEHGIISPSFDTSDENVKQRIQAGTIMPPNSINWSAWNRHLKGESTVPQPGDYITDYFRAGGLVGAFLYGMANIGRDIEKSRGDASNLMLSALTDSVPETLRYGVSQSFLKGVSGLLEGIREGHGDQFFQNWINGTISIGLPNSLAAISRSMREYKPDLKPQKWQDYFANAFKNRVGFTGLDAYMPLKLDVWGRPMKETPAGRNPYVYHMVDVFKFMRSADSPVDLEVYRLARTTSDPRAVPSIPQDEFTIGGVHKKLNRQQYQDFSALIGKRRREYAEALVTNPEYHKMPDSQRLIFLNAYYEAGAKVGKVEFLSTTPLDSIETIHPKAGFSYGQEPKPLF